MDWIKNNHKQVPNYPVVHIKLENIQRDDLPEGLEIHYNTNPKRWDWFTRTGVFISEFAIVKEGNHD